MSCIGCDFNLLKDSARGLILESKASIRCYFEKAPLTPMRKPYWSRMLKRLNRLLLVRAHNLGCLNTYNFAATNTACGNLQY